MKMLFSHSVVLLLINFLFIFFFFFFQGKTFSYGKELGSLYIVHFYEVFIVQ